MSRAPESGRRRLLLALVVAVAGCAAEAAATTRPGEESGRLSIVTQPGVEVVWEGVSLGRTDTAGLLLIEGIPPGGYELRLLKAGYRPRASRVEVVPGPQSARLDLELRPAPTTSVAPPAAAHAPAAETERLARAPAEARPAPLPEARLQVTSPRGQPPEASLTSPPSMSSATPSTAALSTTPLTSPRAGPAEAAAQDSRSSRQAGGLPPVLYLLVFGLLTATGAIALHRRRRARVQAAFPVRPLQSAFEPPRPVKEKPPDFLDDIQKREQRLEDGIDREHADAIDVEVEVIDLGPVEDTD